MDLRSSLQYEPVELGFGTSGLRGLVADMTDLECYINVRGFTEYLQKLDDLDTIYIAGDLRKSTPRILSVVKRAIEDAGLVASYQGLIPTPALAYFAGEQKTACIMVTGSHIPADRNGIKFYKKSGEILKSDEAGIKESVASVRSGIYGQSATSTIFNNVGQIHDLEELPAAMTDAGDTYRQRYIDAFDNNLLAGKTIVFYEHSAVGREIIPEILEGLGATVVKVGYSAEFVSIDTENVTPDDKVLFRRFASENPGLFAVVSTDGDSDRPFVMDEKGEFYRGDVVGLLTVKELGARSVSVPVSANDAVIDYCEMHDIEVLQTKIGSPYVIESMANQKNKPVVGWEVNGGVLLASDVTLPKGTLRALPTRDAVLPILCALSASLSTRVSDEFSTLPQRFTGGGLIDISEEQAIIVRSMTDDLQKLMSTAGIVFTSFGQAEFDTTDGLKMRFSNNEVIHLRASGNAPQARVYTNADTQERADEIVQEAIHENGLIQQFITALT